MKLHLIIPLLCLLCAGVSAQHKVLEAQDLQFPREKMHFDDKQLMLFNGRGFVSPREFGMTSFTNVRFFPIELGSYEFFINMIHKSTQTLIRDDVASQWKKWTGSGEGWDPLGANFRPYAPMVMVSQDESWQPNLYTRTGIFHKQLKGEWITFSMKTKMCVCGSKDEVLLKIEITNRNSEQLDLVLAPNQQTPTLPYINQMSSDPNNKPQGTDQIKINTPFEISSEQLKVIVSSDINSKTEAGFDISIPANSCKTFNFAVQFMPCTETSPAIYQTTIHERFDAAQLKTKQTLEWASSQIPSIETENKQINSLYNRCLLSVLMCRYERENFIISPFWSVGTWPFTISWDNSYASDVLAMLEPESLRKTLHLNFTEGQLKRTYIGWWGATWDLLYLQEPFAQQIMLNAYMNQTGDISILSEQAGDATFYQWMKRWAHELHDNYGRKDGLIDIGASTEKIIEIRTDGYNHVVPIVNILTADLYRTLAKWGTILNDKEAATFTKWADQLQHSIDENLWNEKLGWYENLYPDGSKSAVWTYHLFDLLASENVDSHKKLKLISHIREGVFLGDFGFYSIARNDSIHWDRIDGDWGGGGQYAGMPTRIARNLYRSGNPELAWNVLKRYAKYVDYFPYLTQNPSTDKPVQDLSSMPLEISAGSGVEAILFGTFGITPSLDKLSFTPNYHKELGISSMRGYRYRSNVYDLEVDSKQFKVFRNGKQVALMPLGETYIAE